MQDRDMSQSVPPPLVQLRSILPQYIGVKIENIFNSFFSRFDARLDVVVNGPEEEDEEGAGRDLTELR